MSAIPSGHSSNLINDFGSNGVGGSEMDLPSSSGTSGKSSMLHEATPRIASFSLCKELSRPRGQAAVCSPWHGSMPVTDFPLEALCLDDSFGHLTHANSEDES
jgi:hypothetical protein